MRTIIVYYSLSGTTAKAAHSLAALLGGDLAEVRCSRYGRGFVSYLRAGYDSMKGRLPPIEVPASVGQPCDLMVIATPLWAGHPATPVRAFLAGGHKLPGRVGLLLTRGGSSPDAAFAEMQAQLPGPAAATLALTAKQVLAGKADEPLRAFASELAREDVQL